VRLISMGVGAQRDEDLVGVPQRRPGDARVIL